MVMENVKMKDLIEKLNNRVKPFEGNKINVGEFHSEIYEVIKDMSEIDGLSFYAWALKFDYTNTLIKYNIDIEEDKRYKNERRGRVNKIEFTPSILCDSEDTIGDVINKIKLKESMENLERLKGNLEEQLKEVEETKRYIQETEEEIYSINKVLK